MNVNFRRILPLIALGFSTIQPAPLRADELDGSVIYRQRCQACHGAPNQASTMAPSLAGVVGRRAASTPFNYSTALKNSGVIWTRESLDRFLTAPTRMVPGTRMVINVTNSQQRAALVRYLAGTH